MKEFILNGILWTLAIYGLIEIIKTISFHFTYHPAKTKGMHFIIAVKNIGERAEGILRPILFRNICENGKDMREIAIVDLGSTDETRTIISKLKQEYGNIQLMDWKECKEMIEKEEKEP